MTDGTHLGQEERREVGRLLDLHHEPSMTGIIEVCAICTVTTEDGYVRGLHHYPQPRELPRARSYLARFGAAGTDRPRPQGAS